MADKGISVPINTYSLYPFSDHLSNVVTFSEGQLEPDIWLSIPKELPHQYNIFNVELLGTSKTFDEGVFRNRREPWIMVDREILDLSKPGELRTYKFSFIDSETGDVISYFFSYIYLNNNPDRSYLFRSRGNK